MLLALCLAILVTAALVAGYEAHAADQRDEDRQVDHEAALARLRELFPPD